MYLVNHAVLYFVMLMWKLKANNDRIDIDKLIQFMCHTESLKGRVVHTQPHLSEGCCLYCLPHFSKKGGGGGKTLKL